MGVAVSVIGNPVEDFVSDAGGFCWCFQRGLREVRFPPHGAEFPPPYAPVSDSEGGATPLRKRAASKDMRVRFKEAMEAQDGGNADAAGENDKRADGDSEAALREHTEGQSSDRPSRLAPPDQGMHTSSICARYEALDAMTTADAADAESADGARELAYFVHSMDSGGTATSRATAYSINDGDSDGVDDVFSRIDSNGASYEARSSLLSKYDLLGTFGQTYSSRSSRRPSKLKEASQQLPGGECVSLERFLH